MAHGANIIDIIAPKSIIIPTEEPASTITSGAKGMLVMSGADLFVFNGTAWEIVGAQS